MREDRFRRQQQQRTQQQGELPNLGDLPRRDRRNSNNQQSRTPQKKGDSKDILAKMDDEEAKEKEALLRSRLINCAHGMKILFLLYSFTHNFLAAKSAVPDTLFSQAAQFTGIAIVEVVTFIMYLIFIKGKAKGAAQFFAAVITWAIGMGATTIGMLTHSRHETQVALNEIQMWYMGNGIFLAPAVMVILGSITVALDPELYYKIMSAFHEARATYQESANRLKIKRMQLQVKKQNQTLYLREIAEQASIAAKLYDLEEVKSLRAEKGLDLLQETLDIPDDVMDMIDLETVMQKLRTAERKDDSGDTGGFLNPVMAKIQRRKVSREPRSQQSEPNFPQRNQRESLVTRPNHDGRGGGHGFEMRERTPQPVHVTESTVTNHIGRTPTAPEPSTSRRREAATTRTRYQDFGDLEFEDEGAMGPAQVDGLTETQVAQILTKWDFFSDPDLAKDRMISAKFIDRNIDESEFDEMYDQLTDLADSESDHTFRQDRRIG